MDQNSFMGTVMEFPNQGIHFMLAELIKFRKQLTVRDEFRAQSGWSNPLNVYMVDELEKLADTLENITYNPENVTQEELEARAADTTRSLAEEYTVTSISTDNILMPTAPVRNVVWLLDGTDPDIPQLTPATCPNDAGRGFIRGLDDFFVSLSRLDSRHQAMNITKYESVMMRAKLEVLYALCQRKGGEVNKSDIPTGTLPSQDPLTFEGENMERNVVTPLED